MKKKAALTKAELKLIADMLEYASGEFANNTCNDFTFEATRENKDLMASFIKEMYDEGDVEEELDSLNREKDEIMTCDWMMMEYLSNRCRKLAAK